MGFEEKLGKLMDKSNEFAEQGKRLKDKMSQPTITITKKLKRFNITVAGKESDLDLMIAGIRRAEEAVKEHL